MTAGTRTARVRREREQEWITMRIVLVAALAAVTVGCSAADPMGVPGPEESLAVGEAVTLRRIPAASELAFTGLEQPTRRVVRSEAEWRDVWSQIWSRHTPQPPLPAVDFSREMVLVAGMGVRSSGGYSIRIQSARQTAQGLAVTVHSESPGAGCGVFAALTYPADLVVVPRTSGTVRFVESAATRHCP
jgi:hypothetical protein